MDEEECIIDATFVMAKGGARRSEFGNWLFRQMYWWQVGRFIRDADVRREFVPLLYQQFDATPSPALPSFA